MWLSISTTTLTISEDTMTTTPTTRPTVTAGERRVAETPNAVMTTLASPTLGGSTASLWLVEMHPSAVGPEHAFDGELIWALTRGAGRLTADGSTCALEAGDTVVLPGGVMRQFSAGPDGFTAVVSGPGVSAVTRADGEPAGVPPWVA
jgi:quercetin dioxygenase-like cupin family protein